MRVYHNMMSLINAEQVSASHGPHRILVVTSGVKGLAVLGARFAEVADSMGFDVSLVVTKPALVKRRPLRPARAGVSLLQQARHRWRWHRPAFDTESFATVISRFDGLLVAGTGPALPLIPLAAGAKTSAAVMIDVTMHRHAEQNGWRRNGLFRREAASEAACFTAADRVISLSEWAIASAITDLGIERDRFLHAPPVLNAANAPAIRDRSGDTPTVRLAAIGSPWIRKGMDRTIDWVRRRPEAPIELHLFGDSPGNIADPRIVEHGRVEGAELIESWLPQMDLLVHPTRRDQSAAVAVEAAWAGVATLATAAGGIPELIDDGVTGWLIPVDDTDALDALLDELVADPDRLRSAGLAARRKAEAEFEAQATYAPIAAWLAGAAAAPTAGDKRRPATP